VTTRAFVVQVDEKSAQSLLPAPLVLAPGFAGKQAGSHPLVFLFSEVMPKKAHWMPILVDMPYLEFAVFMPHVRHPELDGDFLHSVILYLDSRSAVRIGRYPYRFPKFLARIDHGEGSKFGRFHVDRDKRRLLSFDYELAAAEATDAGTELQQLDDWFSLPLINWRKKKFTCSRMDWELVDPAAVVRASGRIDWQEDWLAAARRLAPFTAPITGIAFQTRWYLSMPFNCRRLGRGQ